MERKIRARSGSMYSDLELEYLSSEQGGRVGRRGRSAVIRKRTLHSISSFELSRPESSASSSICINDDDAASSAPC